jgi:hypothetical protein
MDAKLKPEETVRRRVIGDLLRLGWNEDQLQWKPEWPIPDTPHDLTKRERNQKFAICGSADLVAFADTSAQWYALQVVFEFKAPDIAKGEAQLMRYLSNEPMAKMGFWTNGAQTLAIYKRHQADWVRVENASLPHPTDDLTEPPDEPPTWNTLREPTEVELAGALRRLVATAACCILERIRMYQVSDEGQKSIHILSAGDAGTLALVCIPKLYLLLFCCRSIHRISTPVQNDLRSRRSHPDQRTSSDPPDWSGSCHEQTCVERMTHQFRTGSDPLDHDGIPASVRAS